MFNCNILPVFLFFLFSLQLVLTQEFVSPASSYSLYLLINPFLTSFCPFCISFTPRPPLATFFTVADIFRVWHAVKSLWRSMCAVWLSVLSHRMMERLAYLWYSSSCFTICLMYSRPLEYNQYSTGEQIAVKPQHTLCHLMTWLSMESLIYAYTEENIQSDTYS